MRKFLLMLALMLPCLGAWAQTSKPVLELRGYEIGTYPYELKEADANKVFELDALTIAVKISTKDVSGRKALFATSDPTKEMNTAAEGMNSRYVAYGMNGTDPGYLASWRGADRFTGGGKVTANTKDLVVVYVIDPANKTFKTYVNGVLSFEKVKAHEDGFMASYEIATPKMVKGDHPDAKIYIGGGKYTNASGAEANGELFNGAIKGVKVYSEVLTADQIGNISFPTCVESIDGFVNGKVYTFVTERGWMGAKDGNNNVISTAKTSHDLTGSKEDANFQWTVYKSENDNYYLYNIGKDMFMGVQASNNASVPFVTSPAGKKLTFKASSNEVYPIMFSTNNAAVVNHSDRYGDGLISWTGGWNTFTDGGSNHNVELVGDLDEETLAKIEKLVAVREIGYFRLKGHSGNYIDASATWGNDGQMSMKAEADCNPAGAIFYYDDNNGFLNYANGRYINETRTLAANNAMGNTWSIYISATEGKYKLLSSANNWLHDNSGNRADRCSSEGDHANTTHSWTLEKVTSLPVTITAAKYATFYAPVAVEVPAGVTAHTVTINGEWATLSEALEVIPANTGVVLFSETAGTYNLNITEDVEAISDNALLGSAATKYFTTAGTYYALGLVEGKVGFYKDEFKNNRFQNNSHKAYLYVENQEETPAPAAALKFRFEDGTTAIESVVAPSFDANAPIYDLSGRRVNAATKGVYIQNGKKFIVK
ncbi:MAG: hypothetical protein J6R79_04680 [Bacteroidaceae bacterium]|nr:hypothetical protein [Bacteroidaceae bacterium]